MRRHGSRGRTKHRGAGPAQPLVLRIAAEPSPLAVPSMMVPPDSLWLMVSMAGPLGVVGGRLGPDGSGSSVRSVARGGEPCRLDLGFGVPGGAGGRVGGAECTNQVVMSQVPPLSSSAAAVVTAERLVGRRVTFSCLS